MFGGIYRRTRIISSGYEASTARVAPSSPARVKALVKPVSLIVKYGVFMLDSAKESQMFGWGRFHLK